MPSKLIDPAALPTMSFDWGVIKPLVATDNTEAPDVSLMHVVLLPGQGHERHNHPDADEILYILSGEGEQIGDSRELGSGLSHGLVHLAPHLPEVGPLARRRLVPQARGKQRVRVEAIPGVCGHPAGGRVWVRQEPGALELGQLGAHRGGAPVDVVASGQVLRAHGPSQLEVRVDHQAEDPLLPFRKHPSSF